MAVKHMTNKSRIISPILLMTTALIWGTAFLAQKLGADHLGPYAFTASRSFLGGCALLVVLAIRKMRRAAIPHGGDPHYWRNVLFGGACCGFWLFVASVLQQAGLQYTDAGVSGFLTANYVLILPILGIFVGRVPRWFIWPAVFVAVAGLYMICMNGPVPMGRGEWLTIACAFVFAVQMQTVDRFAPRTDVVAMSCVQFFTGAVLGAPLMFLMPGEAARLSAGSFVACLPTIAYCGILSSGVAYTFQNLAQASTPPALAAILLSMESVFAALAGRVFLGEIMTARQILGCALVFIAVVFAQTCDILWPRKDG